MKVLRIYKELYKWYEFNDKHTLWFKITFFLFCVSYLPWVWVFFFFFNILKCELAKERKGNYLCSRRIHHWIKTLQGLATQIQSEPIKIWVNQQKCPSYSIFQQDIYYIKQDRYLTLATKSQAYSTECTKMAFTYVTKSETAKFNWLHFTSRYNASCSTVEEVNQHM